MSSQDAATAKVWRSIGATSMFGSPARATWTPASGDGLRSLLSNEALVEVLTAAGPVTIVSAAPVLDPAAKNGFRWSARKGRTLAVSSGTLCTARVMVRETAPITLVVPKLKEMLGL